MKRLIPSQIKEESTVIKGLTLKDLFILIIGLVLIALTIGSSLSQTLKIAVSVLILTVFIISVIPFDMVRGYKLIYYWLLFITRKRKAKNVDVEKAFDISYGETIKNVGGHAAVVELHGIDFGIYEESTQDDYISSFCEAIKEVKNGR